MAACSFPLLTPVIEDNILSSVALNAINIDSIVSLYICHDISEVRVGCKTIRVSQSREDNKCVLHTALLSGFFHVLVLVTRVVSHSGELLKHPLCLSTWQAGMENSQRSHCCSVMPLPLVRPSLVFRVRVSTCLITRSIDDAVQRPALLLNT